MDVFEKAKNTMYEMLCDRGYDIDKADICDVFVINNTTLVYFVQEPKLGITSVKQLEALLCEEGVHHAIVVYSSTVTSFAKVAVEEIVSNGNNIEMFSLDELLFNVTRHHLVPKHTLMPKVFKDELVASLRCKDKNLPIIFSNDPVAKYYGARPGDLFRIDRKDECAPCVPYYRLVTKRA